MPTLLDLTVPTNEFTRDGIVTRIEERRFDGRDGLLPKITFVDPETGDVSYESAASIYQFSFAGTAILTPSAVNKRYDLNIQDITSDQLEGKLLVLDLEPGKQYGASDITELLQSQGILDVQGERVDDGKYIVLFRTGLMDKALETTEEGGVPNEEKLQETQTNKPVLAKHGAKKLAELDIALTYLIDNISLESEGGYERGLKATQILMNPDSENRTFTPLVYHVAKTTTPEFESLIESGNVFARIEFGNIPDIPLTGHPVAVRLYR